MEIIYDDKKGLSKLPKNIKQIGTEPDGRRVYIEDYAYSLSGNRLSMKMRPD